MRIAHVVTYISADGAFGGPVSVALGQAEELAARGHDVELIAGWDGEAQVAIPGVKVSLFRVKRLGRGFSGTVSAGLFNYFRNHLSNYDVVHVHAARDLITLPVALWALRAKVPLFLQPHGMILPDPRPAARLVDAIATRRVVRGSTVALALTEKEERALATLSRKKGSPTLRIANGIKPSPSETDSRHADPVILFLARLHPRKRVMAFAEAGKILIDAGVDATFRIVGPDEGDLKQVEAFIERNRLGTAMTYLGAVGPRDAQQHMTDAMVYVLPSVGEVFPMTVLESMAVGTPVVLTTDCGIADELEARSAAVITDGTPNALADAIGRLLADTEHHRSVSESAKTAVRDWLSIEAVVDHLEAAYMERRS